MDDKTITNQRVLIKKIYKRVVNDNKTKKEWKLVDIKPIETHVIGFTTIFDTTYIEGKTLKESSYWKKSNPRKVVKIITNRRYPLSLNERIEYTSYMYLNYLY